MSDHDRPHTLDDSLAARDVTQWVTEQAVNAADWWTARIREQVAGKELDNGDARLSAVSNVLLGAARNNRPVWSETHFLQFREILALTIDDHLEAGQVLRLGVDYGPDFELGDAAVAAGFVTTSPGTIKGLTDHEYISTWREPHTIATRRQSRRAQVGLLPDLFPWKTNMVIRPGVVTQASYGYAAPWEVIWGTLPVEDEA